MHSAYIISIMTTLVCSNATVLAQQAVDLSGEHDRVFPMESLELKAFEIEPKHGSVFTPISPEELSSLRALGVDPSWIGSSFAIPRFDPSLRRFTQGSHPLYTESWANHHSDKVGLALNDSLRFKVGRTTDLSDGNIAGSAGGFGGSGSGSDDHISSIAQSEGEYDLYDLSLQWDAIDAGPLQLSLMSGVKAIEANIAMRSKDASGNTSFDTEHRVTALPMVGSGVSWQINEDFSIRGSALTQPMQSGDALVDFNAATNLRITRNIDFVAGYRIIRSTFDVGTVSTELTQEGLFARLQINF